VWIKNLHKSLIESLLDVEMHNIGLNKLVRQDGRDTSFRVNKKRTPQYMDALGHKKSCKIKRPCSFFKYKI
jgi:hypothetical protein